MNNILVVAVHPDDETLGCGGTLLRYLPFGEVHWLLVTQASREAGFSKEVAEGQKRIVDSVGKAYPFTSVHQLGFAATQLDTVPQSLLVEKIAAVIDAVRPHTVFLPFVNDPHGDHRVAFFAAYSCTKAFRHPSIQKILMMETPSETDYAPALPAAGFVPNVFVDITSEFARKREILGLYAQEMGIHPFPRSLEGMEALAMVRGAATGCRYAEAFMLIKERLL